MAADNCEQMNLLGFEGSVSAFLLVKMSALDSNIS
jgi:hypothetical protein